jgi:hypothetical protein
MMYREVIACVLVSLAANGVSADGAGHNHGNAAPAGYAPPAEYAPDPIVYADSPPVQSYSSVAAPAGFDMTMLIVPFIALLGLFLLFPTYITLDTVRRKRSVVEEEDDVMSSGLVANMVDRIQDIYGSVIESEECLERIACQIGGLARDAGLSSSMSTGALLMAPTKYRKYAKQFAKPQNCEKIKCHAF